MKRFITIFALGLLAICQAKDTGWKVYTSQAGHFSVSFPSVPEHDQMPYNASGVQTTITTFAAKFGDGALLVSYNDYPQGTVKPGTESQVLVGAENGAVKGANGKLLEEKAFKYGNYNARSYVIGLPQDHVARANIFLVGDRLYQIMAIVPKGDVDSANVVQFFRSFKLAKAD